MTSFGWWWRGAAVLALLLPALGQAELAALSDEDLSAHTGQALLFSDKVAGQSGSGLTFYRMGLDSMVEFNANINKLQLGCGGANNTQSAGCDIDIDYMRFMGRTAGNQPGAPGTDFKMVRPYVELAIKNDGTAQREVVGFKLGAQKADGYVGVGRNYANGEVNQERGGTCTGASSGAGALACHSGYNSLSGYLNIEMSGIVPMRIWTLWPNDGTACFGRTSLASDCADNPAFRVGVWGSRFDTVRVPAQRLELSGGLLGLIGSAYANLTESLRFTHGFSLENTNDFSLSYQRERLAYPNWDKSSYAVAANTGWWMNVPLVKVLDLRADRVEMGLGEAFSSFSKPGVDVTNIELNSTAPSNCYGGRAFC